MNTEHENSTVENFSTVEDVAGTPARTQSPTFAQLGVRDETVEALAAVGITHAFAIQEYAIPIALRGADVIGQAPTGTGKTLGFGVPLLQRVVAPGEGSTGVPQALVVVPTRELGLQVARDIATAGETRGVRVLPVYGGVAYEPQTEALAHGVEIIVGTPGRLLDLAKSKQLRLDGVRSLVLDEADRMLDLGFLDDVEKILSMLPGDRQTMLFSATMPDPIVALSRRFLRQPVTIHAAHPEAEGPSPLTRHIAYRTHPMNKIEVVSRILQASARGLTMIFTRTKRAADRVAEDLDFRGFAAAAVHGDLGQGARERALRAFRSGKIDVLVATDVAARGLDVFGVTHVINYDCPEDAEAYVHRTGRTGRAGASGVAVTFVDWEDVPRWRLIDKSLNLNLPEPPETYHTSPHLFTDLEIDPGAVGTLPTSERTRAGLSAERLEDVEGKRRTTGEHGRGGRSGRGRRRTTGAGSHPSGATSGGRRGPEGPAGEAIGDETPAAPRRRRRRLDSGDAAGGGPGTDGGTDGTPGSGESAPATGEAGGAGPDGGGRTGRTRRRSGSARAARGETAGTGDAGETAGTGGAGETAGTDGTGGDTAHRDTAAPSTADAGSAEASAGSPSGTRRRRRRRPSLGGTGGSGGAAGSGEATGPAAGADS